MTPHHVFTAILVLCAPSAAQFVTSPRDFVDTEGNASASFSLGDYRDGHFMYADGTWRGTPMTIKGAAYRPGNLVYQSSTGAGRKWGNVQLWMSECELAQFGNTFSSNPTTTPTEVFSSAVSWPELIGKPATLPAAWSMQFPFSVNWSYSGARDICLDYRFTAGTLDNGATWSATASPRYYKDAHDTGTSDRVSSMSLGYSGPNFGCNDRGVTHVNGASTASTVTVYSRDYPSAGLRGSIAYQQTGSYFAPSRPALTVIGFKSVPSGFTFPGVTCNKIHVDFALPVLNLPSFSTSGGNLVTINLSANNPGAGGVELVAQVAWADSVNQRTMLSDAARLIIPEEPPVMPMTLLYSASSTATQGTVSNSRSYQPLRRYTL